MQALAKTIRRIANADGAIVLDLRRGAMFRVNPLGARILDLLQTGASPVQISHKLSSEFGVTFDTVENDVRVFLDALQAHGVLDAG